MHEGLCLTAGPITMASLLDYTSLHLSVYTASLRKVHLRKAV